MPQKPSIDLNDTGNRIIAGIILALIFVGGWWLIARSAAGGFSSTQNPGGSQKDNVSTDTTALNTTVMGPISSDTPTIAGSHESVSVEDQTAGMAVKIQATTLAQISWIAVRDADGRTLGAGRFEIGSHENVEVPLLRATVAGERYQVLIYVDDGDKTFDLHKDILVMREDGSVAGSVFSAQ